jgi:hypothetical protein
LVQEVNDHIISSSYGIDNCVTKLYGLDPNHTDLELMEEWNMCYDEYGYLMKEFKDKWDRENGQYITQKQINEHNRMIKKFEKENPNYETPKPDLSKFENRKKQHNKQIQINGDFG